MYEKKLFTELQKRFPEIDFWEEDMELTHLLFHQIIDDWLLLKEVNCADSKVVKRIVSLQQWCLLQVQDNNDVANEIIYTPYIVSLYEDLFQNKKTQILIPYLSTKQEIIDNEKYLRNWCGNKKYEQVLQLFKKDDNRSRRN